MQIQDVTAMLGDLEVFRGLRPDQLDVIAGSMDRIVFRTGQAIIRTGEDGDGAVLLVSGDAMLLGEDAGMTPQPVAPGSLIGEMAMLIEHQHSITVVARTGVRGVKMTRNSLHRAMRDDPSLADHFVHRIAGRLTRVAVELRRIDQMLALAAEGHAG